MRGKVLAVLLLAATWGIGSQASAAIVDYYISGDGSGVLNGVDWSGDFLITLVGDNSTVSDNVGLNEINPLESATVTLPGGVTATLSIGTRLGISTSNDVVFLGRTGGSGPHGGNPDLFDFTLSAGDAAAFNFQLAYGPAAGNTDVTNFNQFQNVATSAGPLSFNTSGDVLFYSTGATIPVPEPSTWAMMLLGFGGLGFAGYRARRATA